MNAFDSDQQEFINVLEFAMEAMKRDVELCLVFGSEGWRRYMRSFHHRDRPRGSRKLRGKRRKLDIRDLYRRAEAGRYPPRRMAGIGL